MYMTYWSCFFLGKVVVVVVVVVAAPVLARVDAMSHRAGIKMGINLRLTDKQLYSPQLNLQSPTARLMRAGIARKMARYLIMRRRRLGRRRWGPWRVHAECVCGVPGGGRGKPWRALRERLLWPRLGRCRFEAFCVLYCTHALDTSIILDSYAFFW